MSRPRRFTVQRSTRETSIDVTIALDGSGESVVSSGIGFLDHLIVTLSRFSRIDISLSAKGDLGVDDHHTAEDCAIVLGSAIDGALGDRAGIARFGHAYAPLDEALARAVVDLSGRPSASVDLGLGRASIGALACENVGHFIRSLATASRSTVHADVIRGENDHHRAEAAFKALALAFRQAVALDGGAAVPSTKGVL